MYGCVPASMSGFTRTEMRAFRERRCACSLEPIEFRSALDVERTDADLQREVDFGAGLADAGEDHRGRIAAGAEHAFEFAAGDDVEAGAERREQIQNREVAVRFDGVADAMRQRLQCGVELRVLRREVGARIDVSRRAATLRDRAAAKRLRDGPHRRGTTARRSRQHARRFRLRVIGHSQRTFLAAGRDHQQQQRDQQQPRHGNVRRQSAGVYTLSNGRAPRGVGVDTLEHRQPPRIGFCRRAVTRGAYARARSLRGPVPARCRRRGCGR